MAVETELKLVADPAAIAAILADPHFFGDGAEAREQRSTYFDDAAGSLAAAGLSLRIRRIGDRRIQTVKAERAGASSLFARDEWERDVPGDTPVLDESTAIVTGVAGRLEPLFTCTVTRAKIVRGQDGSRIELVADRGRVTADGTAGEPDAGGGAAEDAISELEMELIEGEPRALFSLARAVAERIPVRLGIVTKSERGYRLLRGQATRSVRAVAPHLAGDCDGAGLFAAVADACIRQYRLNEDLLIATGGPEPLHQARVAIRRLRSALTMFRIMLAGPEHDRLRDELRWLAGLLGDVRDLDVLAGRIVDEATLHPVGEARGRAMDEVQAALDSRRVRALMPDLMEWITLGAWRDDPARAALRAAPAREHARETLETLRRRIKKRGRHLVDLDEAERHALRIIAKRLRYAAEFFAPLFPGGKAARRQGRLLGRVAALQAALGDLNDIAHGEDILLRLGIAVPEGLAGGGGRKVAKGLIADAVAAFDGLIDEKRFWR